MQQEDEYRIQMELNRYYLRKDSLSAGVSSEQSFYETETARTPSSRGKQLKMLALDWYIIIIEQSTFDFGCYKMEFNSEKTNDPHSKKVSICKFTKPQLHSDWHTSGAVSAFDCVVLFCKTWFILRKVN